jgi:fucokinase
MWDAIVCTCQNRESANAFRKELKIRQKLGFIEKGTLLLTVEDPKPNIGSGSATLNALLCVAERLAARGNQTSLDPHSVSDSRILILLLGSTFPFSSCGHAFLPDPEVVSPDDTFEHNTLYTNMDRLVDNLRHLITEESPKGVWVCSTDMVLQVPKDTGPLDVSHIGTNGIGVVTTKAHPEHAGKHGACKVNKEGEIHTIAHAVGPEKVKALAAEDGTVDLMAGIAYFSPAVAVLFVSFYIIPPLDACTYIALDTGAKPVSVSLFFDIFMCLTKDMSASDFEAGRYSRTSSESSEDESLLVNFRKALWYQLVELNKIQLKAIPLDSSKHLYLRHIADDVVKRYNSGTWLTSQNNVVINSKFPKDTVLGSGSLLVGCDVIHPDVEVGKNCFLSGISDSMMPATDILTAQKIVIPDKIALQEVLVSVGLGKTINHMPILIVYGVEDNLKLQLSSPDLTFCNEKWSQFLKRTGITLEDLWQSGFPQHKKTLMTARLFPTAHPDADVGANEILWLAGIVDDSSGSILKRWQGSWRMSIKEILSCVDCEAELAKMRRISFEKQKVKMMNVLVHGSNAYLKPFFKTSIVQGFQHQLLDSLDEVVSLIHEKYISEGGNKLKAIFPAVCRVYSCIADVLSYMAGEEGGIRAGPASNAAWRKAFAYLDASVSTCDVVPATKALAVERRRWTNNGPDLVMRAARHYEKAAQKITLIMVDTVTKFISLKSGSLPEIGQEVIVTAPARIDIAGGWSDTPPQAYEHGGKVCTVAVKLKGKRPIKVVAKRVAELKIKVTWGSGWTIELTQLSDFSDYNQPSAAAALLKCAFICAGIVDYPSSESLQNQLKRKFRSGFELSSIADIPLGSGLGTSSILGGSILAALFRVSGTMCDGDTLVHAVSLNFGQKK